MISADLNLPFGAAVFLPAAFFPFAPVALPVALDAAFVFDLAAPLALVAAPLGAAFVDLPLAAAGAGTGAIGDGMGIGLEIRGVGTGVGVEIVFRGSDLPDLVLLGVGVGA